MEVIAASENQAISNSLSVLAHAANKFHELAHSDSMRARELVVSALDAAMQCGKNLNEARGLIQHGEWIKWLQMNCPKICRSTANRYMRLAASNVAHVQQISGLRKAYLLADIIQEPKHNWGGVKDIELENSGEGVHEPEIGPVDPMDGRTSEEFPFHLLDGETTVEFQDGDNRQVFSMAAQGVRAALKWVYKGDANSVLSRSLALGWVLGIVDDERFSTFPSQHDLAISYGLHPTSVSRNAAEMSRTYDVHNRAQAHGDGVRK